MVGGDNWAFKSVLGERLWLNRKQVPVPPHHRTVPNLLNGMAALGMVFVAWGVVALDVWPTLLGCTLVYLAKLWFLDRMVWLYEQMKTVTREGGSDRRRTS
ncbi:MAG: hypothetical protein H5T84_06470 [Thermoleophilia bacterium]|nr:hypothetical protein [Thermoleophilia bacterium]